MRTGIALPNPFAENGQTSGFGFAETFGMRMRPRVSFRKYIWAGTDLALFEKSCPQSITSPLRGTRCLSHAS